MKTKFLTPAEIASLEVERAKSRKGLIVILFSLTAVALVTIAVDGATFVGKLPDSYSNIASAIAGVSSLGFICAGKWLLDRSQAAFNKIQENSNVRREFKGKKPYIILNWRIRKTHAAIFRDKGMSPSETKAAIIRYRCTITDIFDEPYEKSGAAAPWLRPGRIPEPKAGQIAQPC